MGINDKQDSILEKIAKNVPTDPEKWSRAKAQAKAKFDVYPSAYANGWAAKKYKEMGGGWKKEASLFVMEEADLTLMEKVAFIGALGRSVGSKLLRRTQQRLGRRKLQGARGTTGYGTRAGASAAAPVSQKASLGRGRTRIRRDRSRLREAIDPNASPLDVRITAQMGTPAKTVKRIEYPDLKNKVGIHRSRATKLFDQTTHSRRIQNAQFGVDQSAKMRAARGLPPKPAPTSAATKVTTPKVSTPKATTPKVTTPAASTPAAAPKAPLMKRLDNKWSRMSTPQKVGAGAAAGVAGTIAVNRLTSPRSNQTTVVKTANLQNTSTMNHIEKTAGLITDGFLNGLERGQLHKEARMSEGMKEQLAALSPLALAGSVPGAVAAMSTPTKSIREIAQRDAQNRQQPGKTMAKHLLIPGYAAYHSAKRAGATNHGPEMQAAIRKVDKQREREREKRAAISGGGSKRNFIASELSPLNMIPGVGAVGNIAGTISSARTPTRSLEEIAKTRGGGAALKSMLPGVGARRAFDHLGTQIRGPEYKKMLKEEEAKLKKKKKSRR